MATLLCGSGRSLRVRGGIWLRRVEAFVLALLLALVLSVPTVRAQTLSSDGSLNWGITKTGPSTSTVNGTNLVIAAAALTIGFVATGGATAAIAATGRAVTVAGSVVGPIAANMLRAAMARGPLTGAMLALAVALGSDSTYDAASNSFKSAGQYGPYTWFQPNHDKTGPFWDSPMSACQALGGSTLSPSSGTDPNGFYLQYNCYSGGPGAWVMVSALYSKQGGGQTQASTDAQLASAASSPGALAKVWDAGGCGAKMSLYRDTVDPSNPCAMIVNSPSAVWTPVGLPNGGYIAFPPKTQTVTDSTGKTTQTVTTTPTAQVTPNTNQATMAASPVTVTPGSVVKTVTNNADGTQTTTTTTSTNPSSTSEQPQDGTAAFNAGTQDLYTKKTRTWDSVLADYQNTVKAAPWFQATTGFFNVSISGASCPRWSVPATKWIGALDTSPYICGSTAITLYQMAGAVVMIVAAWAAFRIAFL